jgi:hypothetical protein
LGFSELFCTGFKAFVDLNTIGDAFYCPDSSSCRLQIPLPVPETFAQNKRGHLIFDVGLSDHQT